MESNSESQEQSDPTPPDNPTSEASDAKTSASAESQTVPSLSSLASRNVLHSSKSPPGGKSLTPWHQWLLKKEVERREHAKKFKLLQKVSSSPKKLTPADRTKKSLEEQDRIVNTWMHKKDQEWMQKKRAEALALQEKMAKEQEVKDITAKMAKLKFKAWKDKKQDEAKQKLPQKVEESSPKPKERTETCENAYAEWLKAVRDREKRQLEFRQLIVRGAYNSKPSAFRNRKQGNPQKSSAGTSKRSILCVLYCAKNARR